MYDVLNRWQVASIKYALNKRRILVLAGARQCGKTTLAKMLSDSNSIYYTLDDVELLENALSDPRGFIAHGDNLMIIDEIQRAPQLLQSIKADVDKNQSYGRFLLTGSSNIRAIPNANESLAGRVKVIRLRPLAYGEIYGKMPDFIDNAFEEKFNLHISSEEYNKDRYLKMAFSGGYPEAYILDNRHDIREWHQDYINSILERDLREIVNIRRQDAMLKLLESLASWSSKIMDISQICSSLSIQRPTVESYINALETLYLVERVQPWLKTDYARVGKKDKIFLTDSGLMSSILKWRLSKVRLKGEQNGKLLETFVFTQLKAIMDASKQSYEISHYRDREKREIDFIIENEDGDYLGIEVKSGTAISEKTFKHLKWFKENLAKDSNFIGIVLYSGNHVLRFGEKMWAVPTNALWG